MKEEAQGPLGAIDAYISYAYTWIILFTIAGVYQEKLGFYGLVLTQLTLVIGPLVWSMRRKQSWGILLGRYHPKLKDYSVAVVMWVGLFLLVNGVTQLLMPLSTEHQEVAQELGQVLHHPHFLMNIMVVAFIPAVCEEIIFRGIIFRGLANQYTPKIGLILSSIFFGMLHLDFIRMVPTTLLGLGMGYVVYRSGSLLLAIWIHFLNNAFIVGVNHLLPMNMEQVTDIPSGMWLSGILLIGVGVLIIALSIRMGYCKTEQRHGKSIKGIQ